MKKLAMLLFLLPASCGSDVKDPTVAATQAFQDWVKAFVDGKGDLVFNGMSDGLKSGWVFDRLAESDPAARRWRGELTGIPRTELDLWLGLAKKRNDGRKDNLPPSVLTHPSLAELFKTYFVNESGLRMQMSRLSIGQAFADDTGVTIAVKNGQGSTELYGLIVENGGWKVDAHREPLGGQ